VTETQTAEVGGNSDTRTYEPGIGRLAAALAAVQAELPRLGKAETGKVSGKNKDGEFFSYEYSYADLASVSRAIMPLLGEHGLAFTAFPTVVERNLVLRYHLLHESGEQLAGEYPLTGSTAQQLGSSITYARRYCLCAVTGIAPDEDDDAAAADGAKAAQQAQQQAEVDATTAAEQAQYAKDRAHGIDAVRGAWAAQYGEFNGAKAEEMYKTWSKGGTVDGATPAQLRAFAAMIHALPKVDAGGDPAEVTLLPPADQTEQQPLTGEGPKMTKLQQGKVFALMSDLSLTERQQQLRFLSDAVGRPLKSRGELTKDDAKVVIDILEEALQNVSGPAPVAQSAAGETGVPAGPETPDSSGGE